MDWTVHMRRILANIGEGATFTHQGGSPVPVTGLFVAPARSVALGGVSISGADPRFIAMTVDLGTVGVDDTLQRAPELGGAIYKVKDADPDDPSGLTVLQLEV